MLIDPTWRAFGIRHEEFTVLDDVQAISHQAMHPGKVADPTRLRAGLKLNSDDRWTRLQFVRGMAKAGELRAAEEELHRVQAAGLETWDVHEAGAQLEMARERWEPALAELQRAAALNPINALVQVDLAIVYGHLKDLDKAAEHMEMALQLDRGEISKESRREFTSNIAMIQAIAQGNSGDTAGRRELERRAAKGDVAAQFALAKALFEETPPRNEEGMHWLRQAAEQGEPQAQLNYAKNLLVLRGDAAAQEALPWLTKSAEQGDDDAQHLLGLLLYEGKLVAADRVAAGQWILLAEAAGNANAKYLFKEMQLFLTAEELAEARKRADGFKPVNSQDVPGRLTRE
jgi:TPR repeat protein